VDLIDLIREDRMALVQHTIQYKFAYQACLYFAASWAKKKGKDIVAGESKQGGGIDRARKQSTKPGGAYVRCSFLIKYVACGGVPFGSYRA
jgi:hypothetical protein